MTVLRLARVAEGARERVLPAVMILAGLTLLFLLAFDQGQALGGLLGIAPGKNLLHEFFHDGRHLFGFACH
jgi:hypothetical protein